MAPLEAGDNYLEPSSGHRSILAMWSCNSNKLTWQGTPPCTGLTDFRGKGPDNAISVEFERGLGETSFGQGLGGRRANTIAGWFTGLGVYSHK
jgi:hypothetical protein